MPTGPHGEKRPADTIGCAVKVMRIATGEEEDELPGPRRAGGLKGGPARAQSLLPEERSRIARKAAKRRWIPRAASDGPETS